MTYFDFLNSYERRLVYHDTDGNNITSDDAKFLWKYMAGLWFYGDRFRKIRPDINQNTTVYWWTKEFFEKVRFIIYKLENPTSLEVPDGWSADNSDPDLLRSPNQAVRDSFFDVNDWLVKNISLTFGSVILARRFVSKTIDFTFEMATRSTPLTKEEILQTNNNISRTPPRVVDVIRATTKQGGLCFLTKFALEISYVDGREELKLVGGELINTPTIFDAMLDFSPREYLGWDLIKIIQGVFAKQDFSMLDYYEASTSYGSTDIKTDWELTDTLFQYILMAWAEHFEKLQVFLRNASNIYESTGTEEQKKELIKEEIRKLNNGLGNLTYSTKFHVWGFKYSLHYFEHHLEHLLSKTPIALDMLLNSIAIQSTGTTYRLLLENTLKGVQVTYGIVVKLYAPYAIIKSLSTDGITAIILDPGRQDTRALEFLITLGVLFSGTIGLVYVAIVLAYELYKFIEKVKQSYIFEDRLQFARLNGLAPEPYANYGIEIDMSQFGQIGNIAIHELLKKYKEREYSERLYHIDENRGVFQSFDTGLTGENIRDPVVLQTDYDWYYNVAVSNPNRPILDIADREGIRWSKEYEYTRSGTGFGVIPRLAISTIPVPKITYRQPIEFYPTITVMDLNGAINNTIEQYDGRLPQGAFDPNRTNRTNMGTGTTFEEAVAGPTERYNARDIPDLFGAGWTTADSEWLAAAEKSIQLGNGNREDLDHILSFNKFVEEVSKPRFVTQRDVSQQGPRTPTIQINYNLIDEANYFNWYADQEITLMSSYVPWYIEEARSLNLITSERISQTNYNFIDRIVEETTILKPRYSNASGTEESDGLFVAPFLPRLLPTKDSSGRILPPMPTGIQYGVSLVPIVNEDGTLSDSVTRGGRLLNPCEINIRRSDGIPLSKYGETSSPNVNPGVKVPKDIESIVNTDLRFRDADLSPECLRYRDQDPTSGRVGRPGDVGQEGPQTDPGSFEFGRRGGPIGINDLRIRETQEGGKGRPKPKGSDIPGWGGPSTDIRPCFASWSKISTPNGLVEIKDIKVGDEVFVFDWFGNVFISNVIETIYHPEKTEVFNYELSNDSNIFITDNHAVLTNGNKFVQIGSLNIGDSLILENGEYVSIVSKESIGDHETYNILTEKVGTYIANGIRVWGSDWFTEWSDIWGNWGNK